MIDPELTGISINKLHSEVSSTETVMAYNKDLDPPPPHDISNVFAAADLLSQSSYDSVKYKRA